MKTPTIPALFYPTSSDWNSVYSQKGESMMRNVKKETKLEVARKLISKGNKNLGSWVEANDFISWNTSTTKKLEKQN